MHSLSHISLMLMERHIPDQTHLLIQTLNTNFLLKQLAAWPAVFYVDTQISGSVLSLIPLNARSPL